MHFRRPTKRMRPKQSSRISLTEVRVRELTAKGERAEYRDQQVPGLLVRVSAKGVRTYAFRYAKQRHTIGRVEVLSLEEARKRARQAAHVILQGGDPATENLRFAEALERYERLHVKAKRLRSAESLMSYLNRHFKDRLATTCLKEIRTRDIDRITDGLLKEGKPSEANHAFAAIRGMLRWCRDRGYIKDTPTDGKSKPAEAQARERVLRAEELAAVWRASSRLMPFDVLARLLLLTGCRRSEIAESRWGEFDLDAAVLTIPSTRTKGKREHRVPLSPPAVTLLRAWWKQCDPRNPFVFPGQGDSRATISGFTKALASLRKRAKVEPFSFHDLRRTCASGLVELGTPPVIIQRVLNHKAGAVSGVTAIYVKGDLFPQMRASLDKWSEYLESLDKASK